MQSTLGAWLAAVLDVPHVPLDEVYWQPGWQPAAQDEFRTAVKATMENNEKGWVIDGDYSQAHGDMILREATDIIWLDPPLILYFPRILIRTLRRLFSVQPPCSPGCTETWSEALSSKGILWWCLSNHWAVRKKYAERMRQYGTQNGGGMRRLQGSGSELKAWKEAVTEIVGRHLPD
ncbi:hypothetical protein PILCRDRAFT_737912 [Piloderma croceum F 1598]|uniref:Uncharacterized protein n=1 Tax=Piloderma croceum (strain F 1598) TaxID=765440 RepID=A0A0C3EJE4_PILCF|nr:hypothetical protein PILCRDRAFT_737912 [Piloderma croceum F 1598]